MGVIRTQEITNLEDIKMEQSDNLTEVGAIPDELGGGCAHSSLPEGYTGRCTVSAQGISDRYSWVLPSPSEAYSVANLAIQPDKGGYSDVMVSATPNADVTHKSAFEWFLG